MENGLYVLAGAVGSIGAFWIVIRYALSRLDSKLDITVFSEFGKRMEASLLSGNKRFERMEKALSENTAMLTNLCGVIGELKGAINSRKVK